MNSDPHKTDPDLAASGPSHAMRQSAARLAAVQALYQIELTGVSIETVISEFRTYRRGGVLEEALARANLTKFEALIRGVETHRGDLDAKITAALAEDWALERLGSVLLSILRSAAFELLTSRDVPAKVIINEYVDLAHAFFEKSEAGFVNGILDRLARELRKLEMEQITRERPSSSG